MFYTHRPGCASGMVCDHWSANINHTEQLVLIALDVTSTWLLAHVGSMQVHVVLCRFSKKIYVPIISHQQQLLSDILPRFLQCKLDTSKQMYVHGHSMSHRHAMTRAVSIHTTKVSIEVVINVRCFHFHCQKQCLKNFPGGVLSLCLASNT